MKGYAALSAAIVAELFATSMLKMSAGFTHLLPSIGVVAGYGAAFYLMALSLKSIPLSLAYAIWSGAGTVITTLIGIWIWHEAYGGFTIAGTAIIIAGIALLNFSRGGAR